MYKKLYTIKLLLLNKSIQVFSLIKFSQYLNFSSERAWVLSPHLYTTCSFLESNEDEFFFVTALLAWLHHQVIALKHSCAKVTCSPSAGYLRLKHTVKAIKICSHSAWFHMKHICFVHIFIKLSKPVINSYNTNEKLLCRMKMEQQTNRSTRPLLTSLPLASVSFSYSKEKLWRQLYYTTQESLRLPQIWSENSRTLHTFPRNRAFQFPFSN